MPLTKQSNRRFLTAPDASLLAEVLDQIVAMRPVRTDILDTTQGPSEATFARVIRVSEDGAYADLGEQPVFWTFVRRQLAKATSDVPWIAGRLVKAGAAYRLDSLTSAEEDAVEKVMAEIEKF